MIEKTLDRPAVVMWQGRIEWADQAILFERLSDHVRIQQGRDLVSVSLGAKVEFMRALEMAFLIDADE